MNNIDNQVQFTNDSNNILDIEKSYKTIAYIDSMRSYAVFDGRFVNLKNIPYPVFKDTLKSNESSPIESRLNAFYRYLGLPAFSQKTNTFYNPGFNPEQNDDELRKKYEFVSKTEDLYPIFNERERIAKLYMDLMQKGGVDCVFVTSLMYQRIRDFNFYKSLQPFDLDIKEQSYQIDNEIYDRWYGIVNSYYNNFNPDIDTINITFNETTSSKRYHFIAPIMTDPRSLLHVTPDNKMFASPFTRTPAVIRPSENVNGKDIVADRCYLEQVCTKRFDQKTTKSLSDAEQTKLKEITNILTTASDNTATNYFSSNSTAVEQEALINNFQTIRSMIKLLMWAYKKIQQILTVFRILIDVKGTIEAGNYEQKSLVFDRSAFENDLKRPKYSTIIDNDLAFLQAKDIIIQIIKSNTSLADLIKADDITISGVSRDYTSLIKERDEDFKNLTFNLRTIEIITGNVGGLGIADILAHKNALYTIDKITLANLLDDDSIARLEQNSSLADPAIQTRKSDKMKAIDVMTKYQEALLLQYKVMDVLIKKDESGSAY